MVEDYQTFTLPHPRFTLTTLPTPLERAERLEAALRADGPAAVPRIYLKRDDLLGLGLGGNKIRNLEFSIGQALAEGATDVLTAGRQQSNHCRLTAAACARAGLRAHLVFSGTRPARLTGNLLLCDLFGARCYFSGSQDRDVRATWLRNFADSMPSLDRRPYVIPVGGSDARGALGHALLAAELGRQLRALGESAASIVLATATGGTQAGLLAGFQKLGDSPPAVRGFAVARSADELSGQVLRLANEVSAEIGGPPLTSADVHIDGSMMGQGYGIATAEGRQASALLARTEGLVADPVYTAKGLAGLFALVRKGAFRPDEAVVFIHSGGAPAIFADSESAPL